jgi:hypothetical protein
MEVGMEECKRYVGELLIYHCEFFSAISSSSVPAARHEPEILRHGQSAREVRVGCRCQCRHGRCMPRNLAAPRPISGNAFRVKTFPPFIPSSDAIPPPSVWDSDSAMGCGVGRFFEISGDGSMVIGVCGRKCLRSVLLPVLEED